MIRRTLLAEVDQLIVEFGDPDCYSDDGECRFHEVVGMFESIDWGCVPVAVIRSVFAEIVRVVPLRYLTGHGAYGEANALLTKVRGARASNAEMRRDAAVCRDDEAARAAALS